MTEIYLEISKLSDKFRTMCYGITKDKEQIDDAVQELYLYFLSMNPSTLKSIWKKDGTEGIIRLHQLRITFIRASIIYLKKR